MHQHLVLALFVEHEHAWPLLLQDGNVKPLLGARVIADGDCSARVRGMLRVHEHAVAPQDAAVALEVGAGEVVVLLERHRRIKAAWRRVDHEEIAEDKVVRGVRITTHGQRSVVSWEHPAQLRLQWRGAHLRQDELCCSQGRDHMALRTSKCRVGLIESLLAPQVLLGNVEEFPLADIVAYLHASFACLVSINQRHVSRRCQLSADLGVEAEFLVVLQARLVHVPRGRDAAVDEVALDEHQVGDARVTRGTPGRHHAEVELAGGDYMLPLGRGEALLQELLVGIRLHHRPHEAQDAVDAVFGAELPAERLLDRRWVAAPVVEELPLGAHPAQVRSSRAGVLVHLRPIVGEPVHPLGVHQHIRRVLCQGIAALQRRSCTGLGRWERLPAAATREHFFVCRGILDASRRDVPDAHHLFAIAACLAEC
mmetsp:Transcript_92361/g.197917  ORF Transcript_92361/g.197917 Transcript_92361/m.197917 type:complete len:425 (+) Transcript_92361:572-1846(+)